MDGVSIHNIHEAQFRTKVIREFKDEQNQRRRTQPGREDSSLIGQEGALARIVGNSRQKNGGNVNVSGVFDETDGFQMTA